MYAGRNNKIKLIISIDIVGGIRMINEVNALRDERFKLRQFVDVMGDNGTREMLIQFFQKFNHVIADIAISALRVCRCRALKGHSNFCFWVLGFACALNNAGQGSS